MFTLLMCHLHFLVEPLALLTFLWQENKFNTYDRYFPVINHVHKISQLCSQLLVELDFLPEKCSQGKGSILHEGFQVVQRFILNRSIADKFQNNKSWQYSQWHSCIRPEVLILQEVHLASISILVCAISLGQLVPIKYLCCHFFNYQVQYFVKPRQVAKYNEMVSLCFTRVFQR